MALINCPHCGHKISDRAKTCPYCGYGLHNEAASDGSRPKTGIPTETPSEFPPVEPQFDGGANGNGGKGKRGNGLEWLLAIILVLLIAGWICFYFYNDNRVKQEEERAEFVADSLRRNSIARAERAAFIADSIRQDSIFRNFRSADLDLFGLQGKVKSLRITDNNRGEYDYTEIGALRYLFGYPGEMYFKFTEDGELVNKDNLLATDDYILGYKYNNSGHLVGIRYGETSGCPTTEISWDGDNKLSQFLDVSGSHSVNFALLYKDKSLEQIKYSEQASMGYEKSGTTTYEIVSVDKWGNWTERKYVSTTQESQFDYDIGEQITDPKKTITGVQTREITYYP